jgi:hypothetical protein
MFAARKILFFIAVLCFSICVESFAPRGVAPKALTGRPSQIKTGRLTSNRQTHLQSQIHDAAAEGDIATVVEIIGKDPKLVSSYDIDGMRLLLLKLFMKGPNLQLLMCH